MFIISFLLLFLTYLRLLWHWKNPSLTLIKWVMYTIWPLDYIPCSHTFNVTFRCSSWKNKFTWELVPKQSIHFHSSMILNKNVKNQVTNFRLSQSLHGPRPQQTSLLKVGACTIILLDCRIIVNKLTKQQQLVVCLLINLIPLRCGSYYLSSAAIK